MLVAAAMVCAAATLPACVNERPIVSSEGGTSTMTLAEQRAWVAEMFDVGVAASGVPDGWVDLYWTDVLWAADRPEDRALLMRAWKPDRCGGGGGHVSSTLLNDTAADPLEAAARVRAYFEGEGLPVRDLYDTHQGTEPYIIVEIPGEGTLSLRADAGGMSLSVRAECSTHSGIMDWETHPDDPGNPFQDELDRRRDDLGAGDTG